MQPKSAVIIIFVILIAILQCKFWFAKDGIMRAWQLQRALALQSQKSEELRQHNAVVHDGIEALKQDDAVEVRARNDLGMIKKGEVFYQTK